MKLLVFEFEFRNFRIPKRANFYDHRNEYSIGNLLRYAI